MSIDHATYPQYTNLALGEGLFDQLMATVEHHLDIEYKKQRLRGADFSKVYLGAMEGVMANTTQYLLGILLLEERRDKLIADTALVEAQTRQVNYETDFVLPAQVDKIRAEIDLIRAQIDKVRKEIEFLEAKILTELANTDETIADPGSVVGRQVELLRAQKLGFAGDIETKTAKLFADYAAIYQTTQESPEQAGLGLNAVDNIYMALQTAEKMKDIDYVDPPFVGNEFPPPTPPSDV